MISIMNAKQTRRTNTGDISPYLSGVFTFFSFVEKHLKHPDIRKTQLYNQN